MQETLEMCLPLAALDIALKRRGHPSQVIHHSDRGCRYASQEYRRGWRKTAHRKHERKGISYGNAPMESS